VNRAAPDTPRDYAGHPCRAELVAVGIAGLLHVATEIAVSEAAALVYNAAVSLGFASYLVWRALRSEGVLRAWGMRLDNFRTALLAQLGFGAVGIVALVAYGAATHSLDLPASFWMTLALYPVWGTAQQFALQNLVARNLDGRVSAPLGVAVVAAALFAMAHFPRVELMVLTFVAGACFTLIYRRVPNLWAVGIVHGILGSLAVYIVLGEDPGRAMIDLVLGR
jgi:membrane protease YdiL (CAAX protease family)